MKILLTGATGYIGKRILPLLVEEGHEVIALCRNKSRFEIPEGCKGHVTVVEGDLLKRESLTSIPKEIDVAYYLVHSMSHSLKDFGTLEAESAKNFVDRLKQTDVKQVIFLSGISREESLSRHLASRRNVENIIMESGLPYTILKAGIIIGSGSASFEIVRDLVEKLPVMIAPRWVMNMTQPIAIYDVLKYLTGIIMNPDCLNRVFEIGGPDQMSYHDLLLRFGKVRGLKRYILPVPVLTPRLSSYWLYFVTSTNFSLAMALVDSLKSDVVCKENSIQSIIPIKLLTFEEAVHRAFSKIEENAVISSWKDSWVTSNLDDGLKGYIQVPVHGCLKDERVISFEGDREQVIDRIWAIGGKTGWYAMNWAWVLRGWIDLLFGGVGLRRGRTHPTRLRPGDALDFWRVLLADRKEGRLLLYAEMKVPGEAWLEFRVEDNKLYQTATFRPHGVLGRLYWYLLYPMHHFVFSRMGKAIVK